MGRGGGVIGVPYEQSNEVCRVSKLAEQALASQGGLYSLQSDVVMNSHKITPRWRNTKNNRRKIYDESTDKQ
jgi:hypothetical protein